jgi:hypothetical protein
MSLKLNFEPHFELCAQSVGHHYALYWDNGNTTFLIPLDLLDGLHSTSFRIFDLRPGVQNVSSSKFGK